MLMELSVEDYAVVDRIRIRFEPGFNILTGETGSGKSIVVDSLGLLLGGRASTEIIRSGAPRARVSGIFEVPDGRDFAALLDAAGVECEDGELLIEREVQASGKSRAFVNSRPVAVALLRDMAPYLGDIHGQHDQQRLFDHAAQRTMLDEAASATAQVARVEDCFARWRACTAELEQLDREEQDKLRLVDLWSFQKREIEEAALQPGEDAELDNELRRLSNVARLQQAGSAAYDALYDSAESAHQLLRIALKRLEEIQRIDASLQPVQDSLKTAGELINDAAHELQRWLDHLEADPARLQQVESRIALVDKLRRKYGTSVAEVLGFLDEVSSSLARVESASERRAQLQKDRHRNEKDYTDAAAALTKLREKAARALEKKVEGELAGLAMAGTRFRVAISSAEWSPHGSDRIEFLVAANVGEEPKPIQKVASGGELSRLALALKAATIPPGAAARPRLMVFDEVDAGIGGNAAEQVGRRLRRIASASQVLCVTHLAQIAGFADHHFSVRKKESKGRTTAFIEVMSGDERVQEIGRMLAGQRLTPEALRYAEQLLEARATL
jgi:DNA repair protein RecN (Recombination protein N)